MTINQQLTAACIEKLSAEGIESFISDEGEDGGPVLRVPRLEDGNGLLCQTTIYGFISCKLDGAKLQGLQMNHPLTGTPYDIYCYDPDTIEQRPDAADLLVWSFNDGATFDWTGLSLGDAGWWDGWELDDCDQLDQRIAFLAYLLSYEVIDLPAVTPLTLEELRLVTTREQLAGNKGLYCSSVRPADSWFLQVNPCGSLVMLMSNADTVLPITADHIDEAGRLVINGHFALTRSTI